MSIYLIGARLIDGIGNEPLDNSVVKIEGNIISFVGNKQLSYPNIEDNDQIIDISKYTILPGLINMHEHLVMKYALGPFTDHLNRSAPTLTLYGFKTCIENLKAGITTVRDMATIHNIAIDLRNQVNEGNLSGPRIFTCNHPICATGGHASEICIEADGPDGVRRAARGQLKLGADFIKVMASHDPYPMPGNEQTRTELTLDEIRAAFEEAHNWGKKTACHVMGKKALSNVLDAGVDIVDHGTYLDDKHAEIMEKNNVYYCPTLSGYCKQTFNPRFSRGETWSTTHKVLIKPLKESFKKAVNAGVKIVCGTDTTGRYSEEVELLREGGLTKMESIMACTSRAAEALGIINEIGTVEVDKVADLVIVDGDPLKDPYDLEKVVMVFKDGIQFKSAEIKI